MDISSLAWGVTAVMAHVLYGLPRAGTGGARRIHLHNGDDFAPSDQSPRPDRLAGVRMVTAAGVVPLLAEGDPATRVFVDIPEHVEAPGWLVVESPPTSIELAGARFTSYLAHEGLTAVSRELPPELVAQFDGHRGVQVARGPGFGATLLQFNATRAPWTDARLRHAVASAIDTTALCHTILLRGCVPGSGGWRHPASAWPVAPEAPRPPLAAVNAQLEALGYRDTDGDGIREASGAPLAPELLVQANQPERLRAAELLRARLREVGLDVTVRALETASLDARVWPDFDVSGGREFDWTMWGWSAQVQIDPFRVVGLLHSEPAQGPNNIGGYRSREADALAAHVQSATGPDAIRTALGGFESLIARDRPFEVLWYADLAFAFDATAYDGWTFQQGHGILHKRSFLSRQPGRPGGAGR